MVQVVVENKENPSVRGAARKTPQVANDVTPIKSVMKNAVDLRDKASRIDGLSKVTLDSVKITTTKAEKKEESAGALATAGIKNDINAKDKGSGIDRIDELSKVRLGNVKVTKTKKQEPNGKLVTLTEDKQDSSNIAAAGNAVVGNTDDAAESKTDVRTIAEETRDSIETGELVESEGKPMETKKAEMGLNKGYSFATTTKSTELVDANKIQKKDAKIIAAGSDSTNMEHRAKMNYSFATKEDAAGQTKEGASLVKAREDAKKDEPTQEDPVVEAKVNGATEQGPEETNAKNPLKTNAPFHESAKGKASAFFSNASANGKTAVIGKKEEPTVVGTTDDVSAKAGAVDKTEYVEERKDLSDNTKAEVQTAEEDASAPEVVAHADAEAVVDETKDAEQPKGLSGNKEDGVLEGLTQTAQEDTDVEEKVAGVNETEDKEQPKDMSDNKEDGAVEGLTQTAEEDKEIEEKDAGVNETEVAEQQKDMSDNKDSVAEEDASAADVGSDAENAEAGGDQAASEPTDAKPADAMTLTVKDAETVAGANSQEDVVTEAIVDVQSKEEEKLVNEVEAKTGSGEVGAEMADSVVTEESQKIIEKEDTVGENTTVGASEGTLVDGNTDKGSEESIEPEKSEEPVPESLGDPVGSNSTASEELLTLDGNNNITTSDALNSPDTVQNYNSTEAAADIVVDAYTVDDTTADKNTTEALTQEEEDKENGSIPVTTINISDGESEGAANILVDENEGGSLVVDENATDDMASLQNNTTETLEDALDNSNLEGGNSTSTLDIEPETPVLGDEKALDPIVASTTVNDQSDTIANQDDVSNAETNLEDQSDASLQDGNTTDVSIVDADFGIKNGTTVTEGIAEEAAETDNSTELGGSYDDDAADPDNAEDTIGAEAATKDAYAEDATEAAKAEGDTQAANAEDATEAATENANAEDATEAAKAEGDTQAANPEDATEAATEDADAEDATEAATEAGNEGGETEVATEADAESSGSGVSTTGWEQQPGAEESTTKRAYGAYVPSTQNSYQQQPPPLAVSSSQTDDSWYDDSEGSLGLPLILLFVGLVLTVMFRGRKRKWHGYDSYRLLPTHNGSAEDKKN